MQPTRKKGVRFGVWKRPGSGRDGFCGWPTALRLSAAGYRVSIVDNLSRRRIDEELGCESLTPIRSIEERVAAWERVTGRQIDFHAINIATEFEALFDLIEEKRPRAIVHFAEQRAAPYSMKSAEKKRYTVENNVPGTHNVLCAIVESGLDVHLVHLGTMGVYGYGTAGIAVPEGYLNVKVDVGPDRQKEIEILYPAHPGSVYHTTKTLDALLFYFYNRNDAVRITDLHQGIVWGTQTPETELDDDLVNRFDYDGDYGTVLNRFLMQAAIGIRSRYTARAASPARSFTFATRPVHPVGRRKSAGRRRARGDIQPGHRDAHAAGTGQQGVAADRRRHPLLRQPEEGTGREHTENSQPQVPGTRIEPHHPRRRPDGGDRRDRRAPQGPLRPKQDLRLLPMDEGAASGYRRQPYSAGRRAQRGSPGRQRLMRILYGVQTTGRGHLTRARPMVAALKARGHDVHILFSGPPLDPEWLDPVFTPIPPGVV